MIIRLFVASVCISVLSACSGPSMAPNKPSRDQANKTLPAKAGVVLDIQDVTIEGDARTAQVVGAGVGGAIANEAARDVGGVTRSVATVAGAAAGAVVGDAASQTVLATGGEEVVIKLEGGRVVSVVQAPGEERLVRGQAVWVVEGSGKTRVFPRTEDQK